MYIYLCMYIYLVSADLKHLTNWLNVNKILLIIKKLKW